MARKFKLAPTTRAIRAALAASVTALALAGSGACLAGTCAIDATPNTVSCNGDFTSLPNGSFVPVADLTLILGDNAPTSVTPAAGTVGVEASWGGNVAVISYADITTIGADGIHQYGSTSATLHNEGNITTHATAAGGEAVDVSAYGDVFFVNAGNIQADGDGGIGTHVTAVDAYSIQGNVGVYNLATGTITAYTPTNGNANGIFASTGDGSINVDNAGAISAISAHSDTLGYGAGAAIVAFANGDVSISNSGSLYAKGKYANGIAATAYGGVASITNTGSVTAIGNLVTGIQAHGDHGAIVNNSGDISVSTAPDRYLAFAIGVQAASYLDGDVTITNSGAVTADTSSSTPAGGRVAIGVFGYAHHGDTTIANSGIITSRSSGAAAGVNASAYHGSASVANSGSIVVDGTGFAEGIFAKTYAYGGSYIENSGSIAATSTDGGAIGARGYAAHGTLVGIINSGDIRASGSGSRSGVTGVDAMNLYGDVLVYNSGAISASGSYYVNGIHAEARYAGAVSIGNSGSIAAVTTYGQATGITTSTRGAAGSIDIANSGSIAASSAGHGYYGYFGNRAHGIEATAINGDINVSNSGAISASALSDLHSYYGQTQATGILVTGVSQASTITNATTGTIHADASTLLYNTARAAGIDAYSLVGTLDIVNAGEIAATSRSGATSYVDFSGETTALGIVATNLFGTATTIGNSSTGVITATASSDHYGAANAIGIQSITNNYGTVGVTNAGAITAMAYADNHTDAGDAATATGILVANGSTSDGATSSVTNSGAITAIASAYWSATANGMTGTSANLVEISSGSITALATADAVHGTALATGLYAYGQNVAVTLGAGSSVNATASGNDGTAVGLSVSGDIVTASNAGSISAAFIGAHGSTYGAIISSGGDLVFTNAGDITASNSDHAVGLVLNSPTSTTLVNSGSITAVSSAAGSIAVLTGNASDSIQNTGSLTGALVTGGGNDTLANGNGGIWNVVGQSTDFGSGDDSITNDGTIFLNNSGIHLGSFTGGNTFTNNGHIRVSGASSIDMGAGNPSPFTNSGSVDFRNGATGDTLTVAGGWAGNGQIGVDVSTLHHSSDMLHINGNVASGSVTTVNVVLFDLPTTAWSSVAVVDVTGNSDHESFVLGDVRFDQTRSFLTVAGVSLSSAIDVSNAHPDVFSVGVAVTGVTDTGALAAALAPGVQNLMNNEVGTWRDRTGVIDKTSKGQVSAWARAFQGGGTVDPGHMANNFGQGGNFAFNQDNSGQELGVDFAISDGASVGLLLGKAQASQRLDGVSSGRNKINGNMQGGYATWLTPSGFYLDASYRWMRFDARIDSVAGETRTHGKADAFNVEAGRAWSFGDGLKIEPQFQYTRTSVSHIDTLSGALAGFKPETGDSSRARAGVLISKDFTSSANVTWTPYASVNAVREFDGKNAFSIDNNFSGETTTKGTSALVQGGLSVHAGNMAVFAGVNWQNGGALKGFAGGQVGLRYTW